MERKVVLITGGAMGQGRAHALKFAENGFDVVLADMQDPAGEVFSSTVKEIEALGVKALAVRCNITSDSDMKVLFEKAWGNLWTTGCGGSQCRCDQFRLYLGAHRRTGSEGDRH